MEQQQKNLFKQAALAFRAVNNGMRQQIISYLEQKPHTVTEMVIKTRIDQSAVSQHLAVLRRENLVKTTRNGKEIIYRLNTKAIAKLLVNAENLVNDLKND